jgi:restriction system protein
LDAGMKTRAPRPPVAWRVHAWGEREIEERLLSQGLVTVGGHELGDLSHAPSTDELRSELRDRFPERNERAIGIFVGYWRSFLYDMQVDDLVAMPLTGRRVAIGRVVGGYEYHDQELERIRHARPVEWLVRDLPRDRFDDDIRATLGSRGTICRLRADDAVNRLEAAVASGSDPGPRSSL